MTDEAVLVEQARAGAPGAFASLVKLHQGRVRAFLSRYVHDDDIADDLAQEAFVSAYHALASYQPGGSFGVWLIVIARNQALAYLRGEARRRGRETESALRRWRTERLGAGGWSAAREDLRISALGDCIRRLPPHSAQIVERHYWNGEKTVAIARELGKAEGVVRMTLLRVRQALRRCVEQKVGTEAAGS
jgi:RNA polymerase sigma-70 factor, ECF subfamily